MVIGKCQKVASAKSRIEATPQIGKTEMMWLRSRSGELFPFATKRRRNFVDGGHALSGKGFKSRLHTHIYKESDYRRKALPSLGDFFGMLVDFDTSNIRNWHIISVDPSKNVKGYLSIRATKQMIDSVKKRSEAEMDVFSELRGYLFHGCPKGKTKEQIDLELLSKFKKLGLIVRPFPMPGYVFNGKSFIKK